MFFYLCIFFLSTLLVHVGTRSRGAQRNIIILLALLIPALVATYRGFSVGADTQNYYDRYHQFISADGLKAMIAVLDTEFFFIAGCFVAKIIGGYRLVFFSYSFLTLLFSFLALYKYRRYVCVWLGYALFLFFFYQASLNIMRQILAVAYILYCTTFLLDGHKKKFFVLAALSVLFHLTAIIAAGAIYLIYLISSLPDKKRRKAFRLYFLSMFLGFFLVDIVIRYLASVNFGNSYAYTSDEGNSMISATDLMYSLIFIYVSYTSMKRHTVSVISPEFFYLSSVTCLMFFMTGYYNQWLSRMAYYMMAFACLYFAIIVKSPKIRKERKIYKLAFLSLGMAYWFYLFVYSGATITIPYSTMGGLSFNF